MPSATITVLSVKSEAEAQAPDVQAFLGFFAQFKELSPTVGFNMILTVHNKNMALRSHLKSKEEQVIDLEKKIRDCDLKKETAINEIFLINKKERQRHQDTQSHAQELQKTLQEKDNLIRKAKAKFRKQTEVLVQAQQDISALQEFASGFYEGDKGSLINDFTGLWQFTKTELYSQFNVNFTTETISNGSAWTNLKHCNLVHNYHIPLPCSNTPPAKQIRLAIILAILAREINKYIFQPCYIIPEDTCIRKILSDLAMTDSEKKSFYWSVLQSINTQAQEKALSSTIQAVVGRVLSYFDNLLTEAQHMSMRSSLEKIVRKAAGDENALTIFPRLSVIENNRMTLHTVVIQLNRSSPLFCAASSELPKATSNSSVVRVMAKTLRGKSANSKGANQSDRHSNGTRKACRK
ncbi:uncharacterized protein BO87DRAFT_452347 [Aspergillus neoniger CBS 115656]|uniref:Uncharacterized protein n=1 Tax=Aspergillus neoniger (strain CBS 115656) TaxID=1448310 RepID=A0A318YJ32_ASPNB|nr:hypothetical protein BO87DRAFT_452347 [Aspergillus neoniger CBS 115656]PYH28318.1 hypothetical protein BO87DRAFT_452347 [Aspergillus neoniger CBS 115656]